MELTTLNRQQAITPIPAQFNYELFNEFVRWIDRSAKTTRSYLTNLKQFIVWLKYAEVVNPIRQDVINYRQWLTAEHDAIMIDRKGEWTYRTDKKGNRIKINCKPNTIAQYLRSVCQFFRWTAANNLYPDIAANIHAPKVNNTTHRKEALTVDEVQTIETSIVERASKKIQAAQEKQKDTDGRTQRATEQGKRLYAIYLLSVNAGLRTIEISRANVKDFETKGGRYWLYIWGKGHTEPDQKKPIAQEVAAAIKDYLKSRTDNPTGSSPLFVSTGNRSGGKRIAETTISKMLKNALIEAGYNSEKLTAHSLRHTAGTQTMELTGNLYQTQQYMRHSNPATTEIYLHNDTDKQEIKIAQRLYNLYHGIEDQGDSKRELQEVMQEMTEDQIKQLAIFAKGLIKV